MPLRYRCRGDRQRAGENPAPTRLYRNYAGFPHASGVTSFPVRCSMGT